MDYIIHNILIEEANVGNQFSRNCCFVGGCMQTQSVKVFNRRDEERDRLRELTKSRSGRSFQFIVQRLSPVMAEGARTVPPWAVEAGTKESRAIKRTAEVRPRDAQIQRHTRQRIA